MHIIYYWWNYYICADNSASVKLSSRWYKLGTDGIDQMLGIV